MENLKKFNYSKRDYEIIIVQLIRGKYENRTGFAECVDDYFLTHLLNERNCDTLLEHLNYYLGVYARRTYYTFTTSLFESTDYSEFRKFVHNVEHAFIKKYAPHYAECTSCKAHFDIDDVAYARYTGFCPYCFNEIW